MEGQSICSASDFPAEVRYQPWRDLDTSLSVWSRTRARETLYFSGRLAAVSHPQSLAHSARDSLGWWSRANSRRLSASTVALWAMAAWTSVMGLATGAWTGRALRST